MARYDDRDTAVSSFSVMLGPAPHLDHAYTVFGRVIPNEESLGTIEAITKDWSDDNLPWITNAREPAQAVGER